MNRELQIFDFHGNEVRIITDAQNDPWFIAKDICGVLDVRTNNIRVILDDDEVTDLSNDYSIDIAQNGGRAPLIVSEAGFYKLVLRSRKPVAKEFQRWVTHEVLPSIRQHGAYMTQQTIEQVLTDPDTIIRLATDLKHEREARAQAERQVRVLEPKAQALDDFTSVEGSYSVGEAAKILRNHGVRIIESQLRLWMADNKWIFRRDKHWVASSRAMDNNWLKMRDYGQFRERSNGERFPLPPQVRVTRKGMAALHRKLFTFDDSLFSQENEEMTDDAV